MFLFLWLSWVQSYNKLKKKKKNMLWTVKMIYFALNSLGIYLTNAFHIICHIVSASMVTELKLDVWSKMLFSVPTKTSSNFSSITVKTSIW